MRGLWRGALMGWGEAIIPKPQEARRFDITIRPGDMLVLRFDTGADDGALIVGVERVASFVEKR